MIHFYQEKSTVMKLIHNIFRWQLKRTNKTLLLRELENPSHGSFSSSKAKRRVVKDVDVFELSSKSNKHIIYLHGGAYLLDGNSLHERFIRLINKRLDVTVHYISYPLSTSSFFEHTVSVTSEVIKEIMNEFPDHEFYVMGDSAGGGLSLAVTTLLDRSLTGYFLLSPWLDISMDNPEIEALNGQDVFFTIEELYSTSLQYSDDLKNPLCSPIYGQYENIENINIYVGTEDLCYPDAVLFEQKFPHTQLHVYEGSPHVFALFPGTKEQKQVLEDIKKIIYK